MNAEKIAYFTPIPLEKKNENEKKTSSTSTTATTPCAGARARAREAFERLMQYYCESFGRSRCPISIQRAMMDALKAGMYAKTICLCIDAAQEAERPTWAYAHAVIERCIQEGALTPEAYQERSARHSGRKEVKYDQRSYTDEEFEKIGTAWLEDFV